VINESSEARERDTTSLSEKEKIANCISTMDYNAKNSIPRTSLKVGTDWSADMLQVW
jgi:hypothetical protein